MDGKEHKEEKRIEGNGGMRKKENGGGRRWEETARMGRRKKGGGMRCVDGCMDGGLLIHIHLYGHLHIKNAHS